MSDVTSNKDKKSVFEQAEEFGSMMATFGSSLDLNTLLTEPFLKKYTQYATLAELQADCGGTLTDVSDFEKLKDTSFLSKTDFKTPMEMMQKAMEFYMQSAFEG